VEAGRAAPSECGPYTGRRREYWQEQQHRKATGEAAGRNGGHEFAHPKSVATIERGELQSLDFPCGVRNADSFQENKFSPNRVPKDSFEKELLNFTPSEPQLHWRSLEFQVIFWRRQIGGPESSLDQERS
jgi:hypothetical protein